MVKTYSYCLYFSKNQSELQRWLVLRRAVSKIVYSTDLNIYFMMAYVISSAVASMLIKYGFILLKIFQIFNTAAS